MATKIPKQRGLLMSKEHSESLLEVVTAHLEGDRRSARRYIKGGAVSVNGLKAYDYDFQVEEFDTVKVGRLFV